MSIVAVNKQIQNEMESLCQFAGTVYLFITDTTCLKYILYFSKKNKTCYNWLNFYIRGKKV